MSDTTPQSLQDGIAGAQNNQPQSSSRASKIKDAFITVPAQTRIDLPKAASTNLVWRGSHETSGEMISYQAQASHVDVRSDTGALIGNMFSMAYLALDENGKTQSTRPVTFAFNGGPGCASVPS